MGGSVFFKVLSLSPYNGECATWLIMYFQNYKFSDDKKEGHGDPTTEAGRKGKSHIKQHQQVKKPERVAQTGLQMSQHAACAI